MTGTKKYLDPAVLAQTVRDVGDAARAAGVRVALIGGFAMQYYGSDRLTGDVDFAADGLLPWRAVRPLSFGGVEVEAPTGVSVDLVVRDDDYAELYAAALLHARSVSNVAVPIVTPEYLTAMKMVAGRGKDDADLEFLIASGEVDVAKARAIVKKYLGPYAAGEFDTLVETAAFLASRRKK